MTPQIVVVNGEMFIRFVDENALVSTFKAKFFGLPNIIPVQLVESKLAPGGYDYLWPVDVNTMPLGDYYKEIGRLPTDAEFRHMISVFRYGVEITFRVITFPSGESKVVGIPGSEYKKGRTNLIRTVRAIVSKYYQNNRLANQYVRDIRDTYSAILRSLDFYTKSQQYALPEPDEDNLNIAKQVISDQKLARDGLETEIIMALASKGLLKGTDFKEMEKYRKL